MSCLRTLGQLFIEPLFCMILGDFTIRLCNLRNERQLATKLQPLNTLISALSLLRLGRAISELFALDLSATTTFQALPGQIHYALYSEASDALSYQLLEGVFLLFTLTLIIFSVIWLRSRTLTLVWLVKAGIFIAKVAFSVRSVLLEDCTMTLNVIILYMYMNVQSLLYDVEDSREKLDRFFSYNFLFFDDD